MCWCANVLFNNTWPTTLSRLGNELCGRTKLEPDLMTVSRLYASGRGGLPTALDITSTFLSATKELLRKYLLTIGIILKPNFLSLL